MNGGGMGVSGELAGVLLFGQSHFNPEWLAQNSKTVVPLASPAYPDQTLVDRLRKGAKVASVDFVLAGCAHPEHSSDPLLRVPLTGKEVLVEFPWRGIDFLMCLPDLSGAVLVTTNGYALLAGTADFVRAAVYEGVDEAKARFARYAKKLARQQPGLAAIAEEYPPGFHAWASPVEVAPGTGVAEQIALMESLVRGDLSATDFESRWLAARRRSLDADERTREKFSRILDDVFYAIEDYVEDPSLRDPGEISGEELLERVQVALAELRSLDER